MTKADNIQIEFYRKLSGEERLKIAFELSEMTFKIMKDGIHDAHPDWSQDQIHFAAMRHLLPKPLFHKAYPSQP